MSRKENIAELIIGIGFVILLALVFNPFGFFMSGSIEYMLIAGFAVVMAVFVAFVWRESARDEREQLHRFMASRVAYLLGAAVMALAIVVQKLSGTPVDPWLVAGLAVMVLGKLAGLFYSRMRH